MRTTIDLPDGLLPRVKECLAQRGITLRTLVITALERELEKGVVAGFTLRDGSVGDPAAPQVSSEQINQAVDSLRKPSFRS